VATCGGHRTEGCRRDDWKGRLEPIGGEPTRQFAERSGISDVAPAPSYSPIGWPVLTSSQRGARGPIGGEGRRSRRVRPISRVPIIVVALSVVAVFAAAAWALIVPLRVALLDALPGHRATVAAPPQASVDAAGQTIGSRFPAPDGFVRVPTATGSFAEFLRSLPLKPDGTAVRLYSGALAARQDGHAAVIDLDVGPRNLQQCADSVIRVRSEYLLAAGRADEIAFHFTSGFLCSFSKWRTGSRVAVDGSRVAWTADDATDAAAASKDSLRRYLDVVFTYAGTKSLPLDLARVERGDVVQPGDVYLRSGSPGHAMLVVDVATRGTARVMLLAQGYMPAQDMHVVRNPRATNGSAWYLADEGEDLATPTWRFAWSDRWRFPAR
jgi:hypothetical protein